MDYSGKLSTADAAALLRSRAKQTEMSHDEYVLWQERTDAALIAKATKAE